jgi:hypothetical protein
MGKPTIRLTIFWHIGEGIRMYLMFDHSGYQIVIVIPDHYLVVAKVRERLAVNKQRSQRFLYGEVQSQEVKRCRE